MQKRAYFFVNGNLLKKDVRSKYNKYKLNLDNKYDYEVYNFGVSKNFDSCKSGALKDVVTDVKGNREIMANTYVAIFKIGLNSSEYKSIDEDSMLASFDILDKILKTNSKLIYSCMFDEDKNLIENFIDTK